MHRPRRCFRPGILRDPPRTVNSMGKGKASKASRAGKSKASKATRNVSKSIASRSVSARRPASKKAAPSAVSRAKAPPASIAPVVAPTGMPLLRKRNVKRGAPPMLPRRRPRHPDDRTQPPLPPRPPTPVGSLHTGARAPEGAEQLRQRLGTVNNLLANLRQLKRALNRQFFEAGLVLQRLSDPILFEAKGYGSFEKFIEREIEKDLSIGRSLAQDLVTIVRLFQREAAEDVGLERLRGALRTLWPEPAPQAAANGMTAS